ncbi:MAG: hypothetical protein Q7S33_00780 [Nanoarchaeota archaeon]|nr:hypothetical protein [Nanoarchaeota archaeon]
MVLYPLIFLGDTHGFINDFIKQKEVIEEIMPEFILSENLQNISLNSKEEYAQILKSKKISDNISFEELEPLIKLCDNKNIKIIGMDLPNFGFDEDLQSKIKNQKNLTKEDQIKLKDILKVREETHISKIKEYLNKTNKPLLIIVGSWHLRKNSHLRKNFSNYKVIYPSNLKGKLLTKPPKNIKDFKYSEETNEIKN